MPWPPAPSSSTCATPAERTAAGVIPGALHIPLDELRERLDEIPAGPVVVHCAVGVRGHTAARILAQHGRDVRNLDGGIRTWQAGTRSQAAAPQPAARPHLTRPAPERVD